MNGFAPRDVPEGLSVTGTDPATGFVARATCEQHEECRRLGMTWMADSTDELASRVYPAFERHLRNMEQYAQWEPEPPEWEGFER
ncbi:hypothetical protein [Nocardia sp. CC227C]|uniref:hypothetical protein n=1 Tax=Nocardia sp. CC227C TaxID=3044562 RepID=UPI00278C6981|nr:hypothetical protein [Nocardia sp. CC227C]